MRYSLYYLNDSTTGRDSHAHATGRRLRLALTPFLPRPPSMPLGLPPHYRYEVGNKSVCCTPHRASAGLRGDGRQRRERNRVATGGETEHLMPILCVGRAESKSERPWWTAFPLNMRSLTFYALARSRGISVECARATARVPAPLTPRGECRHAWTMEHRRPCCAAPR